MQSKAATVAAYLAELPAERRTVIEAVRKAIHKGLDKDYEEGMQYGMIGYYIPHSIFPPGYHCDPKQPLPALGLAAQKNAYSLYLMTLYTGTGPAHTERTWFEAAWAKSVAAGKCKPLDAGKACVRFKKLSDIDLDLVTEIVRRVPAKAYIDRYTSVLDTRGTKPAAKPAPAKKKTAKKTAKKSSKKSTRSSAKR